MSINKVWKNKELSTMTLFALNDESNESIIEGLDFDYLKGKSILS